MSRDRRISLIKGLPPIAAFISEEAKQSLNLYLDKRKQSGETVGPKSPVVATDRGGAMSKRNLSVILRNAFVVAGATKEGEGASGRYSLHPHVLRKWFKTQLISSGVPGPVFARPRRPGGPPPFPPVPGPADPGRPPPRGPPQKPRTPGARRRD